MNNILLLILSIVGLFALYWVLFGQSKHNAMMKNSEEINNMKKEAMETYQQKRKAEEKKREGKMKKK